MDREELKAKIDELMRQYATGEIDGDDYSQAMMKLTASAQD
jgi:O-phosphoseryl-tRNA(Cys) synthetase